MEAFYVYIVDKCEAVVFAENSLDAITIFQDSLEDTPELSYDPTGDQVECLPIDVSNRAIYCL